LWAAGTVVGLFFVCAASSFFALAIPTIPTQPNPKKKGFTSHNNTFCCLWMYLLEICYLIYLFV
jgi:hypothetical protein